MKTASKEIKFKQLCDGVHDCDGNEDEIAGLCKVSLPYLYITLVASHFVLGFVAFTFSGWLFFSINNGFPKH